MARGGKSSKSIGRMSRSSRPLNLTRKLWPAPAADPAAWNYGGDPDTRAHGRGKPSRDEDVRNAGDPDSNAGPMKLILMRLIAN